MQFCPQILLSYFTISLYLLILISCTFVRFSPAVAEVLDKDTPAIFGSDSAAKRNEAFIQEAKGGSLLACFVGEYNHPTVGHFGINI